MGNYLGSSVTSEEMTEEESPPVPACVDQNRTEEETPKEKEEPSQKKRGRGGLERIDVKELEFNPNDTPIQKVVKQMKATMYDWRPEAPEENHDLSKVLVDRKIGKTYIDFFHTFVSKQLFEIEWDLENGRVITFHTIHRENAHRPDHPKGINRVKSLTDVGAFYSNYTYMTQEMFDKIIAKVRLNKTIPVIGTNQLDNGFNLTTICHICGHFGRGHENVITHDGIVICWKCKQFCRDPCVEYAYGRGEIKRENFIFLDCCIGYYMHKSYRSTGSGFFNRR